MRNFMILGAIALLVAGCGGERVGGEVPRPGSGVASAATPLTEEELAGELVVARAGCARCHAMPEASAARLAPLGGPALADAARWLADDGGEGFLRRHHGGDAAPDLAAWLQSLAAAQPPLANAAVSPAAIDRGEKLWGERACQGSD